MTQGLVAEITVQRAAFRLAMQLSVGPGEVVAVLGPNGAGKSTIMNVLAGLLRPDAGFVQLDGRLLTDAATGRLVPARSRRIGLLAQQPLLFPHLSVLENVAFGPRAQRLGRGVARRAAARNLADVGASELADRKPRELSGGQAARVALARALAAQPEALLLDEPLAAVDVAAAPGLRSLLRRLLAGRMALVVTHNLLDALVLADRVFILSDGEIVEQGEAGQVLSRPRSPFAAKLAGLNLLSGTTTTDGLRTAAGLEVSGRVEAGVTGQPAVAVFSPAAVAVHVERPLGSPRNVFQDTVAGLEHHGELLRVRSASGMAADVTTAAVAELELHPGAPVWLAVKATEVMVHPSGRGGTPR